MAPIMKISLRMTVTMLLFGMVVAMPRSAMTAPSPSTSADTDDGLSRWTLLNGKNEDATNMNRMQESAMVSTKDKKDENLTVLARNDSDDFVMFEGDHMTTKDDSNTDIFHRMSFVCHRTTSSRRHDSPPVTIPLCDDVVHVLTGFIPGIELQFDSVHDDEHQQQQQLQDLVLFKKGFRPQETTLSRRVLLSSVDPESDTTPDSSSCGEEEEIDNAWILTINILGSLLCIGFMALASGLFLGFMTLDPLSLRIKIRASVDTEEREYCTKLLPVVENQHRLLVTLLIVDAIAYEALPLFM